MPSDTPLLAEVGRRIADLQFSAIPDSRHELTKLHVLDTLGCMVFGSQLPVADAIATTAGTAPPSSTGYTVVGGGRVASPADAVLANGILAAAFELDSGGAYVHPGPCVLGAALGAAEWEERTLGRVTSGSDFLVAVLAGYETTVRISEWVGFGPEHDVGWHTPAFHGAIGAAAATAKVLGLSGQRTAHALALAADMAGGGLIHARNDAKRIHTGRAAQTGFVAALLAANGVDGGLDVLEHPRWGYRRALRYGCEASEDGRGAADLLEGLLYEWHGYERLAFKYYPFHSICQTVIDNVSELKQQHDLEADDVVSATVEVSSFVYEHDAMLRPAESLATTNFSIPFAVALALAHPVPRLTTPAADTGVYLTAIDDPQVRDFQTRVTCAKSGELDGESAYTFDSAVELRLHSGATVRRRTEYGARARKVGGPGAIGFDNVDAIGLRTKFANLCAPVLSPARSAELAETIDALDKLPAISELIELLATDSGGAPSSRARAHHGTPA